MSKERNTKKTLWIVLGGLCVLVVGLTVGIIATWISGVSNRNQELVIIENKQEILDGIADVLLPMNVGEADLYMDEQIELYTGTDLEFDLKLMKITMLGMNGREQDAITEANLIDVDSLNDEEKMKYYDSVRTVYVQIGDDEEVAKYTDLYMDIYLVYYDGGAGLE